MCVHPDHFVWISKVIPPGASPLSVTKNECQGSDVQKDQLIYISDLN